MKREAYLACLLYKDFGKKMSMQYEMNEGYPIYIAWQFLVLMDLFDGTEESISYNIAT